MPFTFKGGVHPIENKNLTAGKTVIPIPSPDIVAIPLSQHIGAACEPVVSVGEEVFVGQKIGDSSAFVSSPVHSSVSGKVKAIEKRPHATLSECLAVVIENDRKYEIFPEIRPVKNFESLSSDELNAHIRGTGIVGMGGAAFPTHIKLSPPKEKAVDTVILNGAECEPYLTADYRVMLERPYEVLDGLSVMMRILNVKKGIVAIEDNKKDAYGVIKKLCDGFPGTEAVLVKTKYPQGSEKHIISAVLKREVKSGQLPADAGVVVQNVATAAAVSNCFKTGMPLVERVLTASGSGCEKPCNFSVRIGTPFSAVAEAAKVKYNETLKVLAGGPMMGTAVFNLEVPVTKGVSGILFFTEKEYKNYGQSDCIRCGRCVERCPMRLMPFMISDCAMLNDIAAAEKYGLRDCIECGVCSYACPSRRHLVQTIKVAKTKKA
jgi:electron transport complex protein RnfC